MRVRVRQDLSPSGTKWIIEAKRWWWPFWMYVDHGYDEQVALEKAELVKRPKTVEVL